MVRRRLRSTSACAADQLVYRGADGRTATMPAELVDQFAIQRPYVEETIADELRPCFARWSPSRSDGNLVFLGAGLMLQQLGAWPAGLRAVQWIGHLDHRRGDLRSHLALHGARPGLRRRRGRALAGLHRRDRHPRRRRPRLRRGRAGAGRPMSRRPKPTAIRAPRGQPRQAGLEPRRAGAARRAAALPRPPRAGRPDRVAKGRAHALRHGGADHHRPCGARRPSGRRSRSGPGRRWRWPGAAA